MTSAFVTHACAFVMLVACTKESPPRATPTPATSTNGTTGVAVKNTASIGMATMTPDGTIVLQLRAEGSSGIVGDGLLQYKRDHKDYAMVLSHIGGITPGESKPVPPWPDPK